MLSRLSSLTLRARLLALGVAALVALVALATVTTISMSSIGSKARMSSLTSGQERELDAAYLNWLNDDDSNNMYGGLVGLD